MCDQPFDPSDDAMSLDSREDDQNMELKCSHFFLHVVPSFIKRYFNIYWTDNPGQINVYARNIYIFNKSK